jgi:hypothetical protein
MLSYARFRKLHFYESLIGQKGAKLEHQIISNLLLDPIKKAAPQWRCL